MKITFGDSLEERALRFACDAHKGQTDKGGGEYVCHVIRVAEMVSSGYGTNPVIPACAYLHDVVEDAGVGLDEIRDKFGYVVAGTVDALSRRKHESYEDYITRCARDPRARKIKMADLIDNMNLARLPILTIEDARRQKKYADTLLRLVSMEEEE